MFSPGIWWNAFSADDPVQEAGGAAIGPSAGIDLGDALQHGAIAGIWSRLGSGVAVFGHHRQGRALDLALVRAKDVEE
jgi:hypothetical protein